MTKEEIFNYLWDEVEGYDLTWTSDCEKLAEKMYNDGWHKQTEAEWTLNRDGSGTCSNCHFTQRGVYDQDSYQRYCGCCGAKMKLKGAE